MKRPLDIIIIITVIFLFANSSPNAEIDIGYARQSGWSDNFFLKNPDGWTLYLAKSLSQKMSIRFSFSRLENNFTYIGVLTFGLIPPDVVLTRELVHSDLNVKMYEFSLYHALVEGSKMRLDLGGTFGFADYNLNLKGQTTGKQRNNLENAMLVSYGIDVTVKKFIFTTLALRIGYQYRNMETGVFVSDAFVPFQDVNYSSIRVDILARFNAGQLP